MGIDKHSPRLSWTLASSIRGDKQTSFQVMVGADAHTLENDQPDIWDSGKVASPEFCCLEIGGAPLEPNRRYWWKVRVWDAEDRVSPWSDLTWWETGLLDATHWKAQWINAEPMSDGRSRCDCEDAEFFDEAPAPHFRKVFSLQDRPVRARLFISGLGYCEPHLNGVRVGDYLLDPGWTTYSKRVFYSTYNVTDLLQQGENCLGAILGNGWYNPLPLRMWGQINPRLHLNVGCPRLIAQLEIEMPDGETVRVGTDGDWQVQEGPILKNSIFLGEVYDARRELPGWNKPDYDATGWRAASVQDRNLIEPLEAQPQPPIRHTATLETQSLTEPKPGVYIFDLGQNFAGWVRLKARGPAGTAIELRYGELLYPDGTLNVMTSVCGQIKMEGMGGPGAPALACQADTYILKGEGEETYCPRFTFHGFRYVEVTGCAIPPKAEDIQGLRLSADVQSAGEFACSLPLYNQINTISQWTFLSNLFSVQSDCPHRERFGYGGDAVPTCEAFMFSYDMAAFYEKVIKDFADAAGPDGGFSETAPFVGICDHGLDPHHGPIGWAIAHPFLLRKLYQYYGDKCILKEQYGNSRKALEYVRRNSPDHLVYSCIGDHESLEPKSVALTSTAFYFLHARIVADFAQVLGYEEDVAEYRQLMNEIRNAFIEKFLEKGTGRLDTGTQAAQAFALYHDLLPEEEKPKALQQMVEQVVDRHDGHLATGIFGTRYLLDVLSKRGRLDVAHTIASKKSFPGWGYMLKNGATTLWEVWKFSDNVFSHNHPMFGSIVTWFYEHVAGLRPHPRAVGFDRLVIRPGMVGDLKWASARYNSVRGAMLASWSLEQDTLTLEVELPPGASAEVWLPASSPDTIQESRQPLREAEHVTILSTDKNWAILDVPSGRYVFEVHPAIIPEKWEALPDAILTETSQA